MKWVSVKDRLPEDNQSVLVYGGYIDTEPQYQIPSIDVGYYDSRKDRWNKNSCCNISAEVTHWMPLPENP